MALVWAAPPSPPLAAAAALNTPVRQHACCKVDWCSCAAGQQGSNRPGSRLGRVCSRALLRAGESGGQLLAARWARSGLHPQECPEEEDREGPRGHRPFAGVSQIPDKELALGECGGGGGPGDRVLP